MFALYLPKKVTNLFFLFFFLSLFLLLLILLLFFRFLFSTNFFFLPHTFLTTNTIIQFYFVGMYDYLCSLIFFFSFFISFLLISSTDITVISSHQCCSHSETDPLLFSLSFSFLRRRRAEMGSLCFSAFVVALELLPLVREKRSASLSLSKGAALGDGGGRDEKP